MPEVGLDEELAKGLGAAKKSPRNFALIVKGPNPVKLMVRKKKFRDAELMKVKSESKGDDIIVGVLEASGSDFAFKVLGKEEPGVTTLKLKELIAEQADMTAIPRWELVNELPDIGDKDDTPQTQLDTTTSAASTTEDDRAKQLADRLKALGPQIQKAITAQPDQQEKLLAAVASVKTPLAANQIDQAFMAMVMLIELLRKLLNPATQEPDAAEVADDEDLNDLFGEDDDAEESDVETTQSPTGQIPTTPSMPSEEQLIAQTAPPPAVTKSPVVSGRAAWEEARETVAENLAELQKYLAGTKDPDLQKIARYGFQGITGRLQVGLRVALLEFDTGTGEAREKARKKSLEIVEQFQQFVENDPLLRLCDDNLFKIPINGRKILGAALEKLAASLKA